MPTAWQVRNGSNPVLEPRRSAQSPVCIELSVPLLPDPLHHLCPRSSRASPCWRRPSAVAVGFARRAIPPWISRFVGWHDLPRQPCRRFCTILFRRLATLLTGPLAGHQDPVGKGRGSPGGLGGDVRAGLAGCHYDRELGGHGYSVPSPIVEPPTIARLAPVIARFRYLARCRETRSAVRRNLP
jgi:hypothetical protein